MRIGVLVFCGVGITGCQEYDLIEHPEGDLFVQVDDDARADVLFVMDDSASMAEEQARLAENFVSFVAALDSTDADWHLGIVTTDTSRSDAGILRGGVFDPDTPDLEQAVVDALLVGTSGSREEKGFEAATLALGPRNPGLLREDARLNVVFVTDEDDGSPGTAADFLVSLAEVAGAEGYAVHGVVGDLPDGCASGTGAGAPAPRYVEVIDATGGFRDSICADDYADLLTQVGFEAAGLPDTFPLSRVPKTDTLSVRVDGVLIPERDVDGWTYEPGDNAVVFHGRSIPRGGMQVLLQYIPLQGY
jgi:hypothetical protein